ncbi:MAG TPA: MoxR family ATPase [Candidatus Stackebrandtia faecavium]|nr:MoxR family ATPase [Candidatus Stackebrandtia faecavium]
MTASPIGSHDAGDSPMQADEFKATTDAVISNIEKVIEGKTDTIRIAVSVMLAEGHLLIEDVPGVGKTMLAKAMAATIDCTMHRIQFTPDLLPSDVTGVSIYDQETRDFTFKPGAVFANIVVGDEINRASPKTQSALLECMEERQVTVDGTTYSLQDPFMVMATQNPIEMEGTYPLPEAQRDRFTARVTIGYPAPDAELKMLDIHGMGSPLEQLKPVINSYTVHRMVDFVRHIHVAEPLKKYAISLVGSTRQTPELRLGASPRSALHLLRIARAHAAFAGRTYVIPDDLQELAVPVLAHRVLATSDAQLARRSTEAIIQDLVRRVPVPVQGG